MMGGNESEETLNMVIKLPLELKQQLLERIIAYFEQERGESIGWIAAENMLDFMMGELGPIAYNQALADARALVLDRMQQLEDDLYALDKRPPARR